MYGAIPKRSLTHWKLLNVASTRNHYDLIIEQNSVNEKGPAMPISSKF